MYLWFDRHTKWLFFTNITLVYIVCCSLYSIVIESNDFEYVFVVIKPGFMKNISAYINAFGFIINAFIIALAYVHRL